MGDIQDALEAFQKIMQYKYNFVVSHKKVAYELELSFEEKDFRHMALIFPRHQKYYLKR